MGIPPVSCEEHRTEAEEVEQLSERVLCGDQQILCVWLIERLPEQQRHLVVVLSRPVHLVEEIHTHAEET